MLLLDIKIFAINFNLASDTLLSYSRLDVRVVDVAVPDESGKIAGTSFSSGRVDVSVPSGGGDYNIFLSDDGVLDKPIFIVEGFDPYNNRNHDELLKDYKEKGVWNGIRSLGYGYDFVTLIFRNNHDAIENNAQVLKRLINKINTDKRGHFENIIIGESMGGLVTRVALAQMEADNIDHETGLYISLDAPHKGANIPLGLQHLAYDISTVDFVEALELYIRVINFYYYGLLDQLVVSHIDDAHTALNSLSSSAAMQMIIKHRLYPYGDNPTFLNFQRFLRTTGYPTHSRNIALINGSNIGTKQKYGSTILPVAIGGKFIQEQVGRDCYGIRINVDVWVSPINRYDKVSDLEIRTGLCIVGRVTDKNGYGTFGSIPWDISPGGRLGVNLSDDTDFFVRISGLNSVNFNFSFVPTVSSIDLNQNLINRHNGVYHYNEGSTNNKALLVANNRIPFDDIYSLTFNTQHVSKLPFNKKLNFITEQEFMYEEMYLQNRTIKSNWRRDFEAQRTLVAGNDVTPEKWRERVIDIEHPRYYSQDRKTVESGNFVIESGSHVTFKAENSVVLKPGFHVKSGATFRASIGTVNYTPPPPPSAPSPPPPPSRRIVYPDGDPENPHIQVGDELVPLSKNPGYEQVGTSVPQSTSSNTYTGFLPLPTIGIKKSKDGKTVSFEVTNYPVSEIGTSYYSWMLRGEDIEMTAEGRIFSFSGLDGGQYSIMVTINDSKSSSRVFVINTSSSEAENKTTDNLPSKNDEHIVYPNPTTDEVFIFFNIHEDTQVKILIYDLSGKLIKTLDDKFRTVGKYDEAYNVSDLIPGIYLLSVETPYTKKATKLIIK